MDTSQAETGLARTQYTPQAGAQARAKVRLPSFASIPTVALRLVLLSSLRERKSTGVFGRVLRRCVPEGLRVRTSEEICRYLHD